MNSVLSFFQKQEGISNNLTYDFALKRLCVRKEDNWRGITPSTSSSDYNPEPPIFSAKFANCLNYKHILAIANEDGKIALHNTEIKNYDCDEKALEGQQCHYNAVFDLEWAPSKMSFVSTSGDHTARLWEITESEIKNCRIFTGHTRSVKTAAFRRNDSAVFATGGRDGAILIWDTRAVSNLGSTQRADNCIYSGHAGGPGTPVSQRKRTARTPKLCPTATSSSITGLVFQDDNTLISCGAGDGIIKIWDLRRNYTSYKREPLPKHSLPYAGISTFKGFTNLLCDEAGIRLYANCMDNTIYCYNLSSLLTKPMERYIGLRNTTFYIKSCLSPDGNYLISGSSDEKAYIWNLKNPQPLITLNGHTVEVTCVAWSGTNNMSIVTCSDDARHKIWRIGLEKIDEEDKINYKGYAEYCKDYRQTFNIQNKFNVTRNRLQSLDRTPRSLKRIVEENEKTPSSMENFFKKRSFTEMVGEGYIDGENCSDHKRFHLESRGRRLFSPSTSTSATSSDRIYDRELNLSVVCEDPSQKKFKLSPVLNHPNDSNQENSNNTNTNNNDPKSSASKMFSSITEIIDFTSKSPTKPTLLQSTSSLLSNRGILFSPTSNLPNYVLDGDAPHLGIMSPKRKNKEKVDWLTKIRKQKLMSNRTTFNEKLIATNVATAITCDKDSLCTRLKTDTNIFLSSPPLQSLRISENNPNSITSDGNTPKRRISNSGDIHSAKISTTNLRNNETTILRFFSTISQTQNIHKNQHQPLMQNSVVIPTTST